MAIGSMHIYLYNFENIQYKDFHQLHSHLGYFVKHLLYNDTDFERICIAISTPETNPNPTRPCYLVLSTEWTTACYRNWGCLVKAGMLHSTICKYVI